MGVGRNKFRVQIAFVLFCQYKISVAKTPAPYKRRAKLHTLHKGFTDKCERSFSFRNGSS